MATTQSTQRSRHETLPFYALPRERKTSAEIVREARAAIRAIDTSCPFSPVDETESPQSASNSSNRSDSTVSSMSRPLSSVKLAPLAVNKVPTQQDDKTLSEKLDRVLSSYKASAKKKKGTVPVCWFQEDGNTKFIAVNASAKQEVQELLKSVLTPTDYSRLTSGPVVENPEGEVVGGMGTVSNSGSSGFESGTDAKFMDLAHTKSFQHKISLLLEQMDPANHPEGADEKLYQASLQLLSTLKEGHITGKNFSYRPSVLKAVYRILDPRRPKLCLCLAKIIFLLKVTGKNLTSICKLLYKLARDETNDELFLDKEFLECFMEMYRSLHPGTNPNTLMYSTATIKLLALNAPLRLELARLSCVEALGLQLEELNQMISMGESMSNYTSSILIQLISALRNLVEGQENTISFLHSNVIFELCVMQEKCMDYPEIVLNFSRIFSKMTTRSEYVAEINNTYPQCYTLLLQTLKRYMLREDIAIRVCYALGNLIADDEKAGNHLFNLHSSVETFLSLLDHHIHQALKFDQASDRNIFVSNSSLKFTTEIASPASEDVVLKVLRVLSSMTLGETAGQHLADSPACILQLLKLLETKPFVDNIEVMEGTLVLLNNLTYYLSMDPHSTSIFPTIVESLLPMLFQDHLELFVETCRVFGNLTQCPDVRNMIMQRKALPFLMQLLDSPSQDLIFAVCGALLNFLEDEDKKQAFAEEEGIVKQGKMQLKGKLHQDIADIQRAVTNELKSFVVEGFPAGFQDLQKRWQTWFIDSRGDYLTGARIIVWMITLLHDMAPKNWPLGGLICQILWNYTNGGEDISYTLFTSGELNHVIALLEHMLEKGPSLGSEEERVADEKTLDTWQQCFYPMASELLDRLTGWVEKQTTL